MGRPKLSYHDSNPVTKRRKIHNLSNSISSEEVFDLAKKKFKLDKNLAGSKLIDVLQDPVVANTALRSFDNLEKKVMSAEEALSLIIAANLTVHSYNFIRSNAKTFGCKLYPSYKKVNSSFILLIK